MFELVLQIKAPKKLKPRPVLGAEICVGVVTAAEIVYEILPAVLFGGILISFNICCESELTDSRASNDSALNVHEISQLHKQQMVTVYFTPNIFFKAQNGYSKKALF